MAEWVSARAGGCRLEVRVSPRAARERIGPLHDGRLKIALTAPPVEGAANDALTALLARRLAVPRAAVRISHGQHGRTKTVEVDGVSPEAARRLLLE
jgi:uncharacterized protein (TIGR00251 family)